MEQRCTPLGCDACPAKTACSGDAEQIVCRCLQVSHGSIVETIHILGLRTLREMRQHTGAGDGCTCCHGKLRAIIEEHTYSSSEPICSVR